MNEEFFYEEHFHSSLHPFPPITKKKSDKKHKKEFEMYTSLMEIKERCVRTSFFLLFPPFSVNSEFQKVCRMDSGAFFNE